jgi:hypothetical protein
MTSQLSSALRAAAEGIHPDEAAAGLIVSHGTFLHREDLIRHIETTAWSAAVSSHCPSSRENASIELRCPTTPRLACGSGLIENFRPDSPTTP